MKVLVIGNFSDRRCGFQNFSAQMLTAFTHAGHDIAAWDGAYPSVYARQQLPDTQYLGLFPADVLTYDVVHLIWNAMTMNHYNGADWAALKGGPIVSWWDGGPSDAFCPFKAWMQVRWSDYSRDGYYYQWYPVPDWVDALPNPDPVFTVGASSVRGDGVADIRQVCETHGWAMNLPTPGTWVSVEDEVRRLAHSTVNVCWYHTPPLWHNRASAPSMLLASGRALAINHDLLVGHLETASDVYHGEDLEDLLVHIEQEWRQGHLHLPTRTASLLSWTTAVDRFVTVWTAARA